MKKTEMVYKLTNENNETRNKTQWGKNVTHKISDVDATAELCTNHWLHAYENPYLAILLNPIHANIKNPILWEAEAGGVIKRDGQLKLGCTKLTTIKKITLPKITIEQKIEFAIRCALTVYKNNDFILWANNWLNGKNRTAAAAYDAAAYAADAADAADAAAAAAYDAAAYAADAAAYAAADAAAYAAYAAADAAADAAYDDAAYDDAAYAAYAAYDAAAAAADLVQIVKEMFRDE